MKKQKSNSYWANLEGTLSIILNIFLFAIKYWAGIVTGSVALITDAWHTISDSITSLIVLIGNKISNKPPDKKHPFGHGRAEFISSFLIGIIIAIIAFNFIHESIKELQSHKSTNYGIIAIIVTSVSIVLKEIMAQFAIRVGKKKNLRSLIADGLHHRIDSISSVLILIGIFTAKNTWWIDGVLGLLISLLMLYTTFRILKDSFSAILGEKPDDELINKIKEVAFKSCEKSTNPHNIIIHDYGNHLETTFHITLPNDMELKEAHYIATKIENNIKKELNILATIHMEASK
ncbi:MAG: cation diffusion facilitator family transporter [Bacteroidota bacterium]|nr:cation diffusion facilitator family transporter [Bacteroidota bacterium]